MPVEFQWMDEERTTALTTMSGEWTWEEFYSVSQKYQTELKAITHPVYEIIMFERAARHWMPPNAITYGRNLMQNQPNNVVLTIAVTNNAFIRNMIGILLRLTQRMYPVEVVATLQEAQAFITAHKQMEYEG